MPVLPTILEEKYEWTADSKGVTKSSAANCWVQYLLRQSNASISKVDWLNEFLWHSRPVGTGFARAPIKLVPVGVE